MTVFEWICVIVLGVCFIGMFIAIGAFIYYGIKYENSRSRVEQLLLEQYLSYDDEDYDDCDDNKDSYFVTKD